MSTNEELDAQFASYLLSQANVDEDFRINPQAVAAARRARLAAEAEEKQIQEMDTTNTNTNSNTNSNSSKSQNLNRSLNECNNNNNNNNNTTTELPNMIASYLAHNCYTETTFKFISDSGIDSPRYGLNKMKERSEILDLANSGKISIAIEKTSKLFPTALSQDIGLLFIVKSQVYLELIREKKIEEALTFAQTELSTFPLQDKSYLEPLQDIIALMAYDEPESSPIGSSLDLKRRERAANALNTLILRSQGGSDQPKLQKLLTQLIVVRSALHKERRLKGPQWKIKDIYNNNNNI